MLHLIPTPIGNLKDMTFRSVEVLKKADIILAEDTRTSKKLLEHYSIDKKVLAHHEHNERKSTPEVIKMLKSGKNIALISDAGTPGISDPGFYLTRAAIENEIEVQALPGPTAFIPALINSGLPCDRFCFEGFLPHKKGRKTRLDQLKDESRTIIFYESPYRLLKALQQLSENFGPERRASVSREISKMYEETIRGTLSELTIHFSNTKVRGEFVIIVAGTSMKNEV